MRCSDFVVFILWLFLQGESSLASGTQEVGIANQCHGYCISDVKFFSDLFTELKLTADENKDLKNQIYSLEAQLQMKHQEIADKVEQFKNLFVLAKLSAKKWDQQRVQYEAKINSLEAEVIQNLDKLNATIEENEAKGSRIMDLETQIEEYQRQPNTKTEDNKTLTEGITVLETETNKCRDELISRTKEIEVKQAKIMDQKAEIKHCQDQLTIKEGLVRIFESIIHEKESQFENLTSETELLRGKYEARSCLPFVNSTDIHTIRFPGIDPFVVPCNSSVSGSGWTVIQRRVNGLVDFNRNWIAYREGFGNLSCEFFIGLEKLHLMTNSRRHELYIQLQDVNGTMRHARYDNFVVGSEEEGYSLQSLGEYSGTAGDSLSVHRRQKFRTADRGGASKCVEQFHGPCWFGGDTCGGSSLNGKYFENGVANDNNGISWFTWKEDYITSLTFVQMMIRPKTYLF